MSLYNGSHVTFLHCFHHRLSHSFLVKSATLLAISVAFLLIIGKAYVYILTCSLSIQASLIDSILDGFISVLNFFAVRHALAPADDEHRFGHGKVEALAGLGQSLFIAGSALWLLKEVCERIAHPSILQFHKEAIIVMCCAIFLTLLLVVWQHFVIQRTRSLVISADSLHYQTDLYANIGVLISFFISTQYQWPFVDWIVASFVALYIFKTSFSIGKKAFDVLMDRELPKDSVAIIKKIALQSPHVLNVHDLRTRSSGHREFIQMHIEVDGRLTLIEAHEISESLEMSLLKAFPHADIIIHEDPVRP